jgi:NADH dehydrogenase
VFVVGDLVSLQQDGVQVPGVAPAAIQQGRHAARNVVHAIRDEALEPFRYRDKGSFATIGRGAAVGQLRGGLRLWGFPAWVAWMAIHIFFLIGFRNRLLVMFQWAYSYLTFRRGARLITGRGVAP